MSNLKFNNFGIALWLLLLISCISFSYLSKILNNKHHKPNDSKTNMFHIYIRLILKFSYNQSTFRQVAVMATLLHQGIHLVSSTPLIKIFVLLYTKET
jgi:type II secretory pathway component PulF